MELNQRRDLEFLIERAWALHDGLLDEIEKSRYTFCWLRSERGGGGGGGLWVATAAEMESAFQEEERLIAIRDSLKEAADMLVLLQTTRSWQLIDRHAAITRLEDSRLVLLEKVTQYQGRPVPVVKEVNEAKPKSTQSDNVHHEKRRTNGFLICWITMFFETCEWQKKAVGFAAKLGLISAGISSTVRYQHARQQQFCTPEERKVLSISVAKHTQARHNSASLLSSSLVVSYGRG